MTRPDQREGGAGGQTTAKRGTLEDINEEDEQCGIGPCHPRGMQGCARIIFFTLFLSFSGMCTIMQGPMIVSQVTSIERHFAMSSTQLGALMSANDIGFLVLVLVASHFAKNAHAPRMLGSSSILFAIAAILIAALNFIHPYSLQKKSSSSATSNQTRSRNDKYLCMPNLHNRTFNEGCNSQDETVGNVPLLVVFGLFLALQGVSKALRTSLGVTYIDNNVPHRSKSGFYIGLMLTLLMFGPPIGFALGGVISQIPVDLSDTSMSPRDPRWVGAWWIGFLLCGALVFLSALPMLFLPRRMPGRHHDNAIANDANGDLEHNAADGTLSGETEAKPEAAKSRGDRGINGNVTEPKTDVEDEKQNMTFMMMLRELPRSLLRLLKNPVYVLLVLALGIHIFALVGFSSFLIKFVQRQFGLPPHLSSYIFGLSNLVFSGVGMFIGGVLVSRANLTRRGCLRWVLFAGTVSAVLSAVTLGLGCDSPHIVGLPNSEPVVLDDGLNTCDCDVKQYLPVCGGNQTFFSPCHAGCTHAINTTNFANCSMAADTEVKVGVCSPGCHFLIPFIVVQVLSSAFSSTTVTPVYVTILRTMSQKDKTLGLGLLSFTMSIVGFIPGPIVYGAVIDKACLIWSGTCGKSGACALYDVTPLRLGYIGVEVAGKVFALLLFLIALIVLTWQIRTNRTKDEKQVVEKTVDSGEGDKGKGPKGFQMMQF